MGLGSLETDFPVLTKEKSVTLNREGVTVCVREEVDSTVSSDLCPTTVLTEPKLNTKYREGPRRVGV